MRIIGIDPGAESGYIVLTENSTILDTWQMPLKDDKSIDAFKLYTLLSGKADLIVLELPFVRQGNKNKGITTQMINYGKIASIAEISCSRIKEVAAKSWKSKLKIPGGDLGKTKAIERAKQYFPGHNFFRNSRCKKEDHNMAEASLLAYCGYTFYNKSERGKTQ